ncbi:DNA ligase [Amycolatopsis suaedae]|uniref:DNA ligase (ATP) n=2 Tax=Amycolatopsis suaedae TaxID=2510978 RepID=A0A4Q7J4F5_9PSEU|nr:DNA ligase [Amycolatopsis suaedae]
MLASDGKPPTGEWGYEFKWDGFRACMTVAADGTTRLHSRLGNDITGKYPELAGVLAGTLGGKPAILDGELVALDAEGRPEFNLMQTRHQQGPSPALVARTPVTYFVFDLLRLGEETLLAAPYEHRRARLEELDIADSRQLVLPPWFSGHDVDPDDLLAVVRQRRLEGIVAKRLSSPYQPGRRSPHWVKYALTSKQEVVIGGWRPGEGRRSGGLGALLLGAYDTDGSLVYIGDVGTGFTDRALDDLLARLAPLARRTSPFGTEVPRDRARLARWVEPELVGEVEYRHFTKDQRLRHTAWRGLRHDKTPADAVVPAPS